MRIFIGVKISKSLYKEIDKWRNNKKNLFPARYIEDKNLHITLIPPWIVEDPENIINTLKNNNLKIKPFKIKFNLIKFGPKKKHPNLIWAEGEQCPELVKMKEEIENILKTNPQKRSFKPHLTLARFKKSEPIKLKYKELEQKVKWHQEIKSFEVFESTLFENRANYRVITSLKLKG